MNNNEGFDYILARPINIGTVTIISTLGAPLCSTSPYAPVPSWNQPAGHMWHNRWWGPHFPHDPLPGTTTGEEREEVRRGVGGEKRKSIKKNTKQQYETIKQARSWPEVIDTCIQLHVTPDCSSVGVLVPYAAKWMYYNYNYVCYIHNYILTLASVQARGDHMHYNTCVSYMSNYIIIHVHYTQVHIHVHKYMYMYTSTCTCTQVHVHVHYTCTCIFYMYMYIIHVHTGVWLYL